MNRFEQVITLSIDIDSQQEEVGRVHLLPCGAFAANDGRPNKKQHGYEKWQASRDFLEELAKKLNAKDQKSFVIDYEHQTQRTDKNGAPAPAAGWAYDFEVTEKGLFAKVEWTQKAKEYIKNKEYKFISPSFVCDSKGEVIDLINAGLTNLPALEDLQEVLKTNLETKTEDLKNMENQKEVKNQEQTAELEKEWAQLNIAKAKQAVELALLKQQILPAQAEVALQLAQSDLEGFNKFVQTLKTPEILKMQTSSIRSEQIKANSDFEYSKEQIHAAKMLGITVEELMSANIPTTKSKETK